MRRQTLLAAAAIAFLLPATAQGETLGEATSAALQTSPALAAERARLEAVREALPIAWSEALPQITIDASAFDNRRTENTNSPFVREQREYWVGTVRSSTLLFGSGRVWSSTRQARAQIAQAVAQYQDSAQELILEVTRTYGDVRAAQATVAAQEEAVANFTEQRRYVAAHVRNGFLTQTDLAQADARLANSRAELALANARLVTANEAYLRLVGRPAADLTAPNALTDMPENLEAALAAAAIDSPTIVARQAGYDASNAAVGVAAAAGRARVSLETTDSALGVRNNPSRNTEESEDSVALRLSLPLFTGGQVRARTRQQRHAREASAYDLAEAQRRVHEGVSVAWSDLSAARARLESTHARVEAAELANRGIRREQEYGQRSVIDVLDQENELLSARIALAQAEREEMVAQRTLAARVGRVAVLSQQAEEAITPLPQPERRRWRRTTVIDR